MAKSFIRSFRDAYGEGREEWAKAYREGRQSAGMTEDAPRINEMTGAYPTGIRLAEALQDLTGAKLSPQQETNRMIRSDLGIGAEKGLKARSGQLLGTLAADLTQDNTRSFWWLMNAAQAVGNVAAEKALANANPALYGQTVQKAPNGKPLTIKKNERLAQEMGLLDKQGKPTKGVKINPDGEISKRNFEPGDKALLMVPTGIAINAGLGLLSPFGGAEGYEAAAPDSEDKTKTRNVVEEVALKYFMGRTGNLLPYEEFSKVRPDVSREEYNKYQAFKYGKDTDLNPFDDGQVTLPGRIAKATTDGIHGPEVQFLGRSLPLTTAAIPFATALAGGAIGVQRDKPIRGGFVGGMAGLAAGQAIGSLLENERRRRNTVENELKNTQL
jgi:hypothetical protein